jgi:hypothetical protein
MHEGGQGVEGLSEAVTVPGPGPGPFPEAPLPGKREGE